jgi:hypothetical protein
VNPEQIRHALDEYDQQLKMAGSPRMYPSESFVPEAINQGTGLRVLQHLRWMIREAGTMLVEADALPPDMDGDSRRRELRNKAMRWLCFIQGVLWIQGMFTINEMKDHNRPHQPRDEAGITTKEL